MSFNTLSGGAAYRTELKSMLKDFYKSYHDWLEHGAPEGGMFSRDTGLCAAVLAWAVSMHPARYAALTIDLPRLLKVELEAAGLHRVYPFHVQGFVENAEPSTTGPEGYEWEISRRRCHLNKARIAWVKEHAK